MPLWGFRDAAFLSSEPIISAVTQPCGGDTKSASISPVLSIAAEIWAQQDVRPGHRSPHHCQIPEQAGDGAGNMVLALP